MYRVLSWTAVILWMALIFYVSQQPASESNELSTGIKEIIVQTLEKIAPNLGYDIRISITLSERMLTFLFI
jgi:VanZ family protein